VTPETPGDPQKGQVGGAADAAGAETEGQAAAVERAEQAAEASEAGRAAAAAGEPAAPAPAAEAPDAEAPVADAPASAEAAEEEEAPAAQETGVDKAAAATAAGGTGPARSAADTPQLRPRGAGRPAPGEKVLVRAQAKYVRTSARKARLVVDHIRGKDVAEARAILAFTPRAAAKPWAKLLESAVANAEHNHELVGEELRVEAAYADEGPTLKRFRPRAMGRATRIRKRTSHLTIMLAPKGAPRGRGR
jgi:ribosomal protein L22